MKAVLLSDTHGKHDRVKVPPGDLLVYAGDYSHGGVEDTVAFLRWFARHPHRYKVLISGNHDRLSDEAPSLFRSLVAEHPGVTYLQDSGVEIEGLKVWGSPVTPTFFNWHHMRDRGAPIRAHWDLIPNDTDLLVTHGPPHGLLDWSDYGHEHAGCRDLYAAILRVEPRWTCHGHIHGGYGTTDLVHDDGLKTRLFNASVCDEGYHPNNQPWVVDIPTDAEMDRARMEAGRA